ncbi:MAG: hypothetical protein CMJ32_10235 [Phycisphaerae bacterium]|nr:hypothetical protein [Phycisphaerae bacterium]
MPVVAESPVASPTEIQAREALDIFIAVLIIVALAAISTTKRFMRLQRNRVLAALVAGGLPAFIVGVILGKNVLGVVEGETLLEVRPLVNIGLSWIGVIIGMQASRQAVRLVPKVLWKWVCLDTCTSLLISASLVIIVGYWWFPASGFSAAWLLLPILVVSTSTIGWSPETRSLSRNMTPGTSTLASLIQGGSGLSSLIAILFFGILSHLHVRTATEEVNVMPLAAIGDVALVIVIAVLLGLGCRWLLDRTSGRHGERVLVLLGILALLGGFSADLGLSPLLTSMIFGIIIGNMARGTKSLELLLTGGEHATAVFFYVLAGALLETNLPVQAWVVILVLVLFRWIVKPLVGKWMLAGVIEDQERGHRLWSAVTRQAPLAIVIGCSLVLMESSHLNRSLLSIIVIVSIISTVMGSAPLRVHGSARSSASMEAAT